MTLEEICREWIKGCCSDKEKPYQCEECTRVFYETISSKLSWFESLDEETKSNCINPPMVKG